MSLRHIAVILDGNRRFARKTGSDPLKGHEYGAEKVRELLRWLKELGIREVTLYVLSTENLKRTPIEVAALMSVFRNSLKKAVQDDTLKENRIRIRFIGRLEILPKDVQLEMRELMEQTKSYSDYIVNLAVAYGGKAEIVDAARKFAGDVSKGAVSINSLDEEAFSGYLYMPDEPDLLIRPGGECRLSNFLPWQLAYSELIFLDKLWPELTRQDVVGCIEEFQRRGRRFGK